MTLLIYMINSILISYQKNMDRITSEQRKKNMQAVKSSGSMIERILAKTLWHKGYRYRKNDKTVFGKPDLTFKKKRIAIFVDSEFWHGKDWDSKKHEIKSNQEFWYSKIERNIERDKEVTEFLVKNGWTVLRFWGNDILKNLDSCIRRIEGVINEKNI